MPRDRNLSRKQPIASDLLLRWEGQQEYQPKFQHPIVEPPRPTKPPHYKDQVSPPLQEVGLSVLQSIQAPEDTDDFNDNERQLYEDVLLNNSPEQIERFFQRLHKYKKLRDSGLLAGQRET